MKKTKPRNAIGIFGAGFSQTSLARACIAEIRNVSAHIILGRWNINRCHIDRCHIDRNDIWQNCRNAEFIDAT